MSRLNMDLIEAIYSESDRELTKEGANKQVISSQADSLIKISRIWADFFPANTSNQPV
ncbi:ABC transporter [Klebsiella pneumoniae]|nr:ABC transporter [Klebsiella pneumoniae]